MMYGKLFGYNIKFGTFILTLSGTWQHILIHNLMLDTERDESGVGDGWGKGGMCLHLPAKVQTCAGWSVAVSGQCNTQCVQAARALGEPRARATTDRELRGMSCEPN